MAPKQKNEIRNKELGILILLVPVLLVISVSAYSLFVKVAKKNRKVCNYLGRIWLEGVPGDESVRRGCFTYEEVYEYKK